jgi:quercetin dioxygenase-like cupin family protein
VFAVTFIFQEAEMRQWIAIVFLLIGAVAGSAQSGSGPTIVKPGTLTWAPFIPGVDMAVLSGDPTKTGIYTVRLKLADGTKIPPHWHPEDENVTVLRGVFLAGMGDKFDDAALQELPPGTFVLMPKQMHHFAKAKGDTVLQLHGAGPLVINYVNPEDDPAKAKK